MGLFFKMKNNVIFTKTSFLKQGLLYMRKYITSQVATVWYNTHREVIAP